VILDYFDALKKFLKIKKYYFNIFINKKHFKLEVCAQRMTLSALK